MNPGSRSRRRPRHLKECPDESGESVNPVRPWRRRLATTLAGLLTAALAMVLLPGTAYAGPNEGDIFSAVNSARSSAGLAAYSYAGDLAAAARGQAERMAASGELYHNPNLSSEVGGWSRIGENVAFAGDWRSAHDVLMNSPDHRAQILDSGYTQMGVGTAVGDDGTFWVAQVFRTPSGAPSTSGGSGGGTPELVQHRRRVRHRPPPQRQHRRSRHPSRSCARTSATPARRWPAAPRAAQGNDPIAAALDFSTVMDTVSG